jgi:gas vesicle protein
MKKHWIVIAVLSFACLIVFCGVAVYSQVFAVHDLPLNFIGAFLGAVITAVITVVLLIGQSSAEETKEKNVKVFQKKAKIFQKYIRKAWAIWEDQKVTSDEFHELTSGYYRDLMIYLDDKKKYKNKFDDKNKKNNEKPSVLIAKCISNIGDCLDKTGFDVYEKLRENITTIINVLSDQIGLGGTIDPEIIKGHDEKMFPVIFRNKIQEEFSRELILPNSEILENGKWQEWTEGKNIVHDSLVFNFKKYPGCSIRCGLVWNKNNTQVDPVFTFFLVISQGTKYKNVDEFRGKGILSQRIVFDEKVGWINLYKPTPKEKEDEESRIEIKPFDFRDNERMKKIREEKEKDGLTYMEIANTLAKRAVFYFSKPLVQAGNKQIGIPEFVEEFCRSDKSE